MQTCFFRKDQKFPFELIPCNGVPRVLTNQTSRILATLHDTGSEIELEGEMYQINDVSNDVVQLVGRNMVVRKISSKQLKLKLVLEEI